MMLLVLVLVLLSVHLLPESCSCWRGTISRQNTTASCLIFVVIVVEGLLERVVVRVLAATVLID